MIDSNNFHSLPIEDLNNVAGGESIWYWIAYGAGATVRAIEDFELPSGRYEWSPARPYG